MISTKISMILSTTVHIRIVAIGTFSNFTFFCINLFLLWCLSTYIYNAKSKREWKIVLNEKETKERMKKEGKEKRKDKKAKEKKF